MTIDHIDPLPADGAAEAVISLRRARQLFRDLEFSPSVLRDVSRGDMTTSMLGRESALPFFDF